MLLGMKQLTGEGLKNLMSRSLRQLSLQGSTGITDPGLSALLRNCPNVEKLCLAELDKLTDATFVCLAEVLGDKLVSWILCNWIQSRCTYNSASISKVISFMFICAQTL